MRELVKPGALFLAEGNLGHEYLNQINQFLPEVRFLIEGHITDGASDLFVVVLNMHVEVGLSGAALVTKVTLEASHVFVHDQLVTVKVTTL